MSLMAPRLKEPGSHFGPDFLEKLRLRQTSLTVFTFKSIEQTHPPTFSQILDTIMQLSANLVGLIALLLSGAEAVQQMKINYYNDQQCTAYAGEIMVDWASPTKWNCFNFNYGKSVNIAECYTRSDCWCHMHKAKDCEGSYALVNYHQPGQNCLSNANEYNSFRCYAW
ncbi:hypothetical protein B0I35DRAFT_478584 [Stachybotrys elegans]|uniref:Uncharacterized protein n=1 Tax=Stachybotrys elegans TaxID=80388 RepID=A0A8K0SU36_9HYPO|nr:hypothetical protein B0I35DRAFT_478584 [Stachybotrys elegans]